MIETQWISFSWTPIAIAFASIVLLAMALAGWVASKRSGFRRATIILEVFRLLLAAMLLTTLLQPEWTQEFSPEEEPIIAVLYDESSSMSTRDVVDANDVTAQPLERAAWVKSMMSDEIWAPILEKVQVIKQPYSSNELDSKSGSDINAALEQVLERNSNLRGVVLFSDGSWNVGQSPTKAATKMRLKDVPVFGVVVGGEIAMPDLEVTSLDAPTYGVANKPVRIPFTITSTIARTRQTEVTLTTSNGDLLTRQIEIPANGTFTDAFSWTPKKVGEYSLELDVPVDEEELVRTNNSLSSPISVREESIKVLVVESFPRWEYRYLRNALLRDPGVDVKTIMFHPQLKTVGDGIGYLSKFPSKEQLAEFDVIFLGDVGLDPKQLSALDCTNIRGVVNSQASGLILMPGGRGNQMSLRLTDLEPLIPIQFDHAQRRGWGSTAPSKMQLTEIGEASLLTKLADNPQNNRRVWQALPGFQWYAPVLRAKSGTQVLAVHETDANENGRIPLLVTKTFGAGKVLFMGTDGAWRWRKGVEDRYHYRFWGQVARWMAYQRNMAGGSKMRLYYSPDRPKTGATISLNANVASASGEPLQSGQVNLQILTPSGQTELIKLQPARDDGQWGLFTNTFTPREVGRHQVTMTCRENGELLETSIDVQGARREKIGKPVNRNIMEEIASITRGKLVSTSEINEILDAIENLPPPDNRIRKIKIWASPFWGGFIVLLLGAFWIGRKLTGAI